MNVSKLFNLIFLLSIFCYLLHVIIKNGGTFSIKSILLLASDQTSINSVGIGKR